MLKEEDKIFTNLHGQQSHDLKSSKKRGDWENTKALLDKVEISSLKKLRNQGLEGEEVPDFLPV